MPEQIQVRGAQVHNLKNIDMDIPLNQIVAIAGVSGSDKSSLALGVLDEPSIGLHPLDVRTLLEVFQTLIEHGATVVVIEHDLDVIRNADYIIDMGPGGGEAGGRVVAVGTPEEIAKNQNSITGQYLT